MYIDIYCTVKIYVYIYIIRGSSSLYRAGVLHQTFGIFQSRSFGEMDPISIYNRDCYNEILWKPCF